MKFKKIILIIIVILYVFFSIIAFYKLFPVSNIVKIQKLNYSNLAKNFNPLNLKIKNSNSYKEFNGKEIEEKFNANLTLIKTSLINYYLTYNWSITTNNTSLIVKKSKVIVDYTSSGKDVITMNAFIPTQFSSTSSLFKTTPNQQGYPFDENELTQALLYLNSPYNSNIEVSSFNFNEKNFLNVINVNYNIPVEEIKGISYLPNPNDTSSVLNFYINKFNSLGYIPFTVNGAIIDNNTIYYLKYGLGGLSVEISIKNYGDYSLIYYTLKISGSKNSNFLSFFNKSGWRAVFY